MAIKLVTDSTSDLPREVAEQWDITVIPCNIHFEDEVFKDGIDIGPDEFYRRLVSSPKLPTTAQPSMNDFLQVYKSLWDGEHDILSIHLSAKLSGTLNSANQAREALPSEVLGDGGGRRLEIIDSQLTSMGLGLITLAAARLVKAGASFDEAVESVQTSLSRTHCYFLLDTLEYLQKGGRIGKASAFLGSILSIKPILKVQEGQAHPVERVRTKGRGLERLSEIIRSLAPAQGLSVLHSTTPDEAGALMERLGDLVPERELILSRFGPVMGTYLGPGALGVSLMSSR